MSEFEIFVVWAGTAVAIILGLGAILASWVAIRESNKSYLQAYQEFLEQKNRVEKRLEERKKRRD